MPSSSNPARRVPPSFKFTDDANDDGAAGTGPSTSTLPALFPSAHFLAQSPLTPPAHPPSAPAPSPPLASTSSLNWIDSARPDTSSVAAADFDVSVETGFLPPAEPVRSLASLGNGWDDAERCLEAAKREVEALEGGGVGKLSETFRVSVRSLPLADTSLLTTLPLLRRAHTLLAHLTHFYMHSSFPSQTTVPRSLAVPLVHVSDLLGLPPILTYADTVLWVWHLIDPSLPLRADNVDISTTFTGSSSERAFFLLSLYCELYGPKILRLMSATLDESFFADAVASTRIATYLVRIAHYVDELRTLLHDAVKGAFGPGGRDKIVPEVFYWEIRPWFNGGRWVYEGVGPRGEDVEMEWGGPSAGQSSLVHAIDLFLGIDHAPRHPPSLESSAKPKSTLSDSTFMERMSTYMPHHHRSFLQHLTSVHSTPSTPTRSPSTLPSVRSLAQSNPSLRPAYDAAVAAMKRFRDTHIVLATHFIVQQARHAPKEGSVHWAEWEAKRLAKENERLVRDRERAEGRSAEKEVIAGTGGTDLSVFLKMCRDRTREALIEPSASSS
ncbi:hypothetical protein JCM10212_004747 [Sporobolomyces blumeae]